MVEPRDFPLDNEVGRFTSSCVVFMMLWIWRMPGRNRRYKAFPISTWAGRFINYSPNQRTPTLGKRMVISGFLLWPSIAAIS